MNQLYQRRCIYCILLVHSLITYGESGFQAEDPVLLEQYYPQPPPAGSGNVRGRLIPVPPVRGDESILYRSPLTHMASIRGIHCPATCFCSKTTWNCDSATLTEAPTGMPPTILYGNFHNNNIKSIPSNFLVNLPNLQVIDLRNNDIEELNVGAFVDLPQLITILLDDNVIRKIEIGAFSNLPAVKHIRISNNSLVELKAGTFQDMPNVETIRLSLNRDLAVLEPGVFRRLDSLIRIQMNGTSTNYTHIGPYDYGKGRGERTFAPDCPNLREIDFGRMKIRALEPDTLQNISNVDDYLLRIRRVGPFMKYSTILSECDLLNQGEIMIEFDTVTTTTICAPTQGARQELIEPKNPVHPPNPPDPGPDSPSTSQKDHLEIVQGGGGRRRLISGEDLPVTEEDAKKIINEKVLKSMGNIEEIPSVIHGMPIASMDRRHLVESLQAGIIYEEFL